MVVVPPGQQEEEEKPAREHVFFLVPEWKAPQPAKEQASIDEVQTEDRSSGPPAVWEWNGDETMHPFWAIQRVSEQKKDAKDAPNMGFQNLSFSALTVGVVAQRAVNMTTEVIVPFLTNSIEIPRGAELRLQINEAKHDPRPNKRTWKDSVAEERKATPKKAARTGQAESPGAAVDI